MAARTKEMQAKHDASKIADAKVTELQNELSRLDPVIARDTETNAAIAVQNIESADGAKAYEKWAAAEDELHKKRQRRKYLVTQLDDPKKGARAIAQLAQRIVAAAEQRAQIDRNAGFWDEYISELAKADQCFEDGHRAWRKAIDIAEKKIAPSFVGDLPQVGFGLKAGELVAATENRLYRFTDIYLGGTPGARAPIRFPGGKCGDIRLYGMPEKMPLLAEWATNNKNFAMACQLGERRFDGKEPDKPTPADPATWAQPGPSVAPAVETPGKSPHIEGLKAAPADDDLASILGPVTPPAPAPAPKPRAGKFFDPSTKTWITSSVDDGDPYTPEQIAQMEADHWKKSPKGAYPAPAPKRRLD